MARTKPARFERVTFPGGDGDALAARLDRPAAPPRAYALFAHCFTCGKDLRSAGRLAAALTGSGFAVLRFDFTGLGSSEGEFANTNFSSNTADLLAAVDWLRREHAAPQLLVGHSLGGAAVLAVAGEIAEVNAVVTLGAPADTEHLTSLFEESADEIIEKGEACVSLAGRSFTITKGFVDDLSEHRVVQRTTEMKKPLLVMHSPIDNTVGVEHAGQIFEAARHPKSFVSLDGADHLLTDPHDADFAAGMTAAFAERYISDQSGARAAPDPTMSTVVAETTQGPFLNHVVVGRHRLFADEPESIGGFDAGPAPYDFLGAALGSCTSMTLRMYATRKQFALDRVTVEVAHDRVHADDLEACVDDGERAPRTGQIDRFERVITLEGDELSDGDRQALLAIADKCPVHRTLESSSIIQTRLA